MSDNMGIKYFRAEEMGWVRRCDLGVDVWEKPDGTLYKAPSQWNGYIVRRSGPPLGSFAR